MWLIYKICRKVSYFYQDTQAVGILFSFLPLKRQRFTRIYVKARTYIRIRLHE